MCCYAHFKKIGRAGDIAQWESACLHKAVGLTSINEHTHTGWGVVEGVANSNLSKATDSLEKIKVCHTLRSLPFCCHTPSLKGFRPISYEAGSFGY